VLPMQEKIRSSWKEIASYLGRSVRTAQRWERELGLPVRRPSDKESSSVLAFPQQVDQWLKSIGVGSRQEILDLPESVAGMPKPQLLALLRNLLGEEDILFAQLQEKRSVSRKILAQLHTLDEKDR
jgi:hypothetical protein